MLALALAVLLAVPDLQTTFDTSPAKTGRYDEVVRLCSEYATTFPEKVRCIDFGQTPEGRPMLALAVSMDGALDPEVVRAKKRPVVMFQGGIHAGEIDGKDAGFLVVRELLDGSAEKKDKSLKDALSKVTLLFVPVFNVDGHERFGKWNRSNQTGPEEMGWRTTAQNLNLNRDYVKADAPEMQAMLKLLNAWDPAVMLDLHVTDGAQFRHEIAVLIDPTRNAPAALAKIGEALRKELGEKLAKQKHLPITEFYPAFAKNDEPSSGFGVGDPPPRFSQSYWAAHNRIGILVETHSWKSYATRVAATHDTLLDVIAAAARDGGAWLDAEKAADDAQTKLAGKQVALLYDNGKHTRTIDFLGYAYRVEKSEVSGANWIHYDTAKPEVWKVPLADELVPVITVTAPLGGYVIPAGYAREIAAKLAVHGIEFTTLKTARPALATETFRATKVEPAKATYEGRTRLTLEGAWAPETRDVPAGSLFVPIAQPRALLVLHLFEPTGPDSLVSWGFFDTAFEAKEYMESYVAEQVARDLMAKDSALKAEFEKKVAGDPEFAKDPEKRLDFFYRRTPSFDERLNLVPVYRVGRAP